MGFGEGLGRAMAAEGRAKEKADAAGGKDWFTKKLESFSEALAKTIKERTSAIEERARLARAELLDAQANTLAEKLDTLTKLFKEGDVPQLDALMKGLGEKITELRNEARKLKGNADAIEGAVTAINAALIAA
jgi:hypothetical protein